MNRKIWVLTIYSTEQVYCFDEKQKALAYLYYHLSLNCCDEHYEYAKNHIDERENYIQIFIEEDEPCADLKLTFINPFRFFTEVEFQQYLFSSAKEDLK